MRPSSFRAISKADYRHDAGVGAGITALPLCCARQLSLNLGKKYRRIRPHHFGRTAGCDNCGRQNCLIGKNCAVSASKCRCQTAKCKAGREIADEIAVRPCVLAVVNTRKHARKLFAALPSDGIKTAFICQYVRHTTEAEVIALVRRYWHCIERAACTSLYGWLVRS